MNNTEKAETLILLDKAFLNARQQIIHILEKNSLEIKIEPLKLKNNLDRLSNKIFELLVKELNGKDN